MPLAFIVLGTLLAATASLLFSSLTYSLRDYSRTRLAEYLGRRNSDGWFEAIVDHEADLIYLTAIGRQVSNILIWLGFYVAFDRTTNGPWLRYALSSVLAVSLTLFTSITVPHAAAKYAAADLVGFFAPFLAALRRVFGTLAKVMHGTDSIFRRALDVEHEPQDQIDQEILSVVQEGEEEGVVGEEEREMIESVIEFRDTTAGQIMTARPEIAALDMDATLDEVKDALERTGHSRIPVYENTLDQIVGILYARDLIKLLGRPADGFDIRSAMRPAFFVPETKPLRDLLNDFRTRKVHMAIVLDEYGGTAGLVTIEDILEELVGDISDEHEPTEPPRFHRVDERTIECDARIYLDELNAELDLKLPEDAGFDTLGGFLSTSIGRIPEKGTVYEHDGVKYTILDAEPRKVNRVRVELKPAAEPTEAATR